MTTSTEHTQDELQSFHSAWAPDMTASISAWDFPDSRAAPIMALETSSGDCPSNISAVVSRPSFCQREISWAVASSWDLILMAETAAMAAKRKVALILVLIVLFIINY